MARQMKAKIERALAPYVAHSLRRLIKLPVPQKSKEQAWKIANHFFLHHSVKVVGHDKFGHSINCRVDEFIQKHIAVFGIWEPRLTSYLLSTPRSGIFLDVGANIGYHSLLASALFDGVIAFEPSSLSFSELLINLDRNCINNVRAFQVAISDRRGKLPFYKGADSNSGLSSTKEKPGLQFEAEVTCAPFEDYLTEEDWSTISFIKIDVEGAELEVIKSLLPNVSLLPLSVEIMIEVPGNDPNGRLIFESMINAGFLAFDLSSTYRPTDYFTAPCISLEPIDRPPTTFTDCIFKRASSSGHSSGAESARPI